MLTKSYRKAKHFKLQYDEGTEEKEYRDGEYFVADEFTGNAKRPIKYNWWCYEHGRKHWQLKYAPTIRHIESRVGQNWDTIYSDICHIANKEKAHVRNFILDRVKYHVIPAKEVNMIDGVPHRLAIYSRSSEGWEPISMGDLYVHPETKILCRVPVVKKVEKIKPSDTRKFEDGSEFILKKNTYTRRIGCGATEEVVHYSWFKKITEKYWGEERYSELVFGPHYYYDHRQQKTVNIEMWHREIKYRSALLTRYKFISASKKDIKKYKLNNSEGE